ncbi:MAG: UDP-N-acetylmuramoyl-tripeptide--D-alanyl-D-alanine ligase [Bacteroidetes bacterium]|nr:MAG: UDP-N-acetylmuramoyl-tripeptide--D-alanyl-D-alanine ligase [Bacteroidota bacterium]
MTSLDELFSLFQQHPDVCTDTRLLRNGSIFFALKGDNFDGNKFAAQALAAGAAFAVVDDPDYVSDPDRCLLVPDVLTCLQQLATRYRRQFDIPVIAIGGSNGKTTTKELVSAVLSSHYPCHATTGNLNNHIGVPLTLLSMPPDTEVAVIEMGTNQPGDMDLLCTIAEPSHGLLTNIGKEHLEGFGDLEGVKLEEGALYRYLTQHNGCAFVNASESDLPAMSAEVPRRVFYRSSEKLHQQEGIIDVHLLAETPFLKVAFLSEKDTPVEVQSQLIGRFNFQNIMTAIALGVYFKVPASGIASAIGQYTPANNRSQLIRRGNTTIFMDAYNANPSSMRAALETLLHAAAPKKVAIIGDMLELGDASLREHEAILEFAAASGLDQLVVVGPEFGRCAPGRYKALHFPDAGAAADWFRTQSFDDTFILVKASRGIRLERVLQP